jgi:hypothetical protein
MGSHLSTTGHSDDCLGPTKDISFFQTVRTKWIEYFIAKLNENALFDLKITNTTEMLNWKDYFYYFNEIKEFSKKDNEIKKRLTWHPATIGYLMQIEENILEIPEPMKGPSDDYTEDEADSDLSDSESTNSSLISSSQKLNEKGGSLVDSNDEEEEREEEDKPILSPTKRKFIPPKHWNSSVINPIYFGYSSMTLKEHQETLVTNQIEIEKSERRAVEKAMQSRLIALEEYETAITTKEKIRIAKLEEMEAAYAKERQRRDADLARNKKSLPEMGFTMYRVSLFLIPPPPLSRALFSLVMTIA